MWFRTVLGVGLATLLVSCGDGPTEPVVRDVPRSIAFATSTTDDGLSITTDKDDYQPGDTVHLTGAGWEPFDVLDILLVDEPQTHEPHAWAVSAGMDGTFGDSTYVVDTEDLGVTFTLTATSRLTGRSLRVTFTDNINNIVIASVTPLGISWNPSSEGGNERMTIRVENGTGQLNGVSLRIRPGTAPGAIPAVKTFSFSPMNANSFRLFEWDGRKDDGVLAPEGVYTVRITAGGADLQLPAQRRTIWVDNTNPSVTLDPLPAAVRDQPMTITGTAADLPVATASGVAEVEMWIFGPECDGILALDVATNTGTNFSTWSFSYTPTDILELCVMVFAEDNGGNKSEPAMGGVTGEDGDDEDDNEAPIANAGGQYTVNEGTSKPLDGTASLDPDGDDLSYLWSVDFTTTGGGYLGIDTGGECRFFDPANPGGAGTLQSDVAQPSIKCNDDGVFRLTLVVTDEHGLSSDESEAALTVQNVAPSVSVSPASRTINEGGTAAFTATVTDPGQNDHPTFVWSTTVAPCSLAGSPAATLNGASFACADNGTGRVKLEVDDQDQNGRASAEANLTVQNVAPTATFNAPAGVDEGSPFMLSMTSPQDPSSVDLAAGLQYAFDCGDGAGYGSLGSMTTRSCPTTDDATRAVKGKILDKDGDFTEYTATVEVENVAPTILTWTPSPSSVIIGTTLNFTATFSDPGADTHTTEVDCGSGYGGPTGAASPFEYSCTFGSIGQKTIRIRIQDDDGDAAEEIHTLTVVYSFSGFFAPVDRPNIMNISKAGQAIPLKWRLTDATGHGIPGVTGVTVKAYGISCAIGTNNEVIQEYAAGASGLQDLGDGYYQFNWKTPGSYLGMCKSIALVFGTGGLGYTEKPSAFFTFKK